MRRHAAALGVVDVLHHGHRLAVPAVLVVGDVAGRLRLEAGEAGVGDDEPADRLAGALVVVVGQRDLDEAAELERVRVLARAAADLSGGVDRTSAAGRRLAPTEKLIPSA